MLKGIRKAFKDVWERSKSSSLKQFLLWLFWLEETLVLSCFVSESFCIWNDDWNRNYKNENEYPHPTGNTPSDYVGFGSESYMMWFLDSVLTLNGFTQNLYKRTQKGHRKRGFLSHIRVGKWNPYMKKEGMIEHEKIRKEVGKEKG